MKFLPILGKKKNKTKPKSPFLVVNMESVEQGMGGQRGWRESASSANGADRLLVVRSLGSWPRGLGPGQRDPESTNAFTSERALTPGPDLSRQLSLQSRALSLTNELFFPALSVSCFLWPFSITWRNLSPSYNSSAENVKRLEEAGGRPTRVAGPHRGASFLCFPS